MEHKRDSSAAPRKRRGKSRALEAGKDLLIVLLICSALYLALRSQMNVDLAGDGWLGTVMGFFDRGKGSESTTDWSEGEPIELRPLRMAVRIAGVGAYGVQYDTAAVEKLSDKMYSLLGEALGGAEASREVTEQVWQSALSKQDSVYFDFGAPVPLAALYAWTEAGPGDELAAESARQLLLAEDKGGTLTLYYCNETTGLYYACDTADTLDGHLQTAVLPYTANVNDMAFAFERKKGEGYEKLWPYVMLSKGNTPTARAVYRAANPMAGGSNDEKRLAMLEDLGFHPQANTSYVAGGKQVIRDGADTLSVYDNGTVDYHSATAEEAKYPIGDGSGAPTGLELLEGTYPLAEASIGALCGDARTARIYLCGIAALENGDWQVDYGYALNGAAVQLGSEGYAARFVVSEGRISDFYLVLRTYTATDEQIPVLPELQAAAAMGALDAEGKELLLCYEDGGGNETIQPGWIAK